MKHYNTLDDQELCHLVVAMAFFFILSLHPLHHEMQRQDKMVCQQVFKAVIVGLPELDVVVLVGS